MAAIGILLCIAGVIALIVGGVGLSSSSKRLAMLSASSKQKLGELLQVLNETKATLNGIGDEGTIRENVTVMGRPMVDQPLISPISGMPCLYYTYRVSVMHTEYYMETVHDANGNDRQVQRSRTREQTLDQGHATIPSFRVDDGTGVITVEPQDGEFDGLVQTVDKSERNYNGMIQNGALMVGRLSFGMNSLGMNNMGMNNMGMGGMNPLGGGRPELIKYREEIFGLDRNVTVVGNVCDNMGDFRMRSVGKSKVLVSSKSSSELYEQAKRGLGRNKIVLIAGGVGLVVGILLSALGGGSSKDAGAAQPSAPAQQVSPTK